MRTVPVIRFPGPSSAFGALEVFRFASSPLRFLIAVHPLTGSVSPTETPRRCCLVVQPLAQLPYVTTPMGFSAPPAFAVHRIGISHRLHPIRLPPSAFLRPLGASSSMHPVALFHTTDAHGVSCPPEPFPPRQLYPTRRQAIPSRRFSCFPKDSGRAPRAFCRQGVRFQSWSISSIDQADALLGFHPLLRLLCSPA